MKNIFLHVFYFLFVADKTHSNQHFLAKYDYITSENISIYIDVWCSLNGRFQQRMYNPNYDLLNAKWSPFTRVEWLLPLLTEYNDFRQKLIKIQEEVYSWSNYTDLLFIADFPGKSRFAFVINHLVATVFFSKLPSKPLF